MQNALTESLAARIAERMQGRELTPANVREAAIAADRELLGEAISKRMIVETDEVGRRVNVLVPLDLAQALGLVP